MASECLVHTSRQFGEWAVCL